MIETLIVAFLFAALACLYIAAMFETRAAMQRIEAQRFDLWQPCGRRVSSLVDAAYHGQQTPAQIIEVSNSYAFMGFHAEKTVLRDAALAVALRDRIEADMARYDAERRPVRALVRVQGVGA